MVGGSWLVVGSLLSIYQGVIVGMGKQSVGMGKPSYINQSDVNVGPLMRSWHYVLAPQMPGLQENVHIDIS